MPIPILRDEVQRLLRDEKAQLVEVLPQQEYEDEHIAGAMSIPLKRLGSESVGGLEKGLPVIVY
ncbi:MAG: rhodanese-like domain-containing protein [Chloroflexi bacterium]|nr:rhodanese-like domain-containing protein [Chloroflexota bacterium]